MRAQLRRLGLAHDRRRSVATIDPGYYRWTQWIFLQIFDSWYDEEADRARPVAELAPLLASGARPMPTGVPGVADGTAWADLDEVERRRVVDAHRLAYVSDAPVNWCPGLGTVLANEEVTADGRCERGNFPVFKRNLRQWKMRITAYADRLLTDLDGLDWPESDQAEAAQLDRPLRGRPGRPSPATAAGWRSSPPGRTRCSARRSWWSRRSTRWSTCWRPAPGRTARRASWTGGAATPRDAVAAYRRSAELRTDLERQTEGREKTGVFTGGYATNPVNGEPLPVFIADYVLMGYGTGAIMAVPGQDERDCEFATRFELPIVRTVAPPEGWDGRGVHRRRSGDQLGERRDQPGRAGGRRGEGADHRLAGEQGHRRRHRHLPAARLAVQPAALLGRAVPDRLRRARPAGRRARLDAAGRAAGGRRLLAAHLRPEDDATSEPEPPLARKADWVDVELDLGDGPKRYRRETNTMPNWAGLLLVRAALPGPDERGAVRRPGDRALLDGAAGRGPPRRRRPVRRRRRARGAAPAVRAVLAQGAARPGSRLERASRSTSCSTRA